MPKATVNGWKCRHCGHTWKPRDGSKSGGQPVACPKCRRFRP